MSVGGGKNELRIDTSEVSFISYRESKKVQSCNVVESSALIDAIDQGVMTEPYTLQSINYLDSKIEDSNLRVKFQNKLSHIFQDPKDILHYCILEAIEQKRRYSDDPNYSILPSLDVSLPLNKYSLVKSYGYSSIGLGRFYDTSFLNRVKDTDFAQALNLKSINSDIIFDKLTQKHQKQELQKIHLLKILQEINEIKDRVSVLRRKSIRSQLVSPIDNLFKLKNKIPIEIQDPALEISKLQIKLNLLKQDAKNEIEAFNKSINTNNIKSFLTFNENILNPKQPGNERYFSLLGVTQDKNVQALDKILGRKLLNQISLQGDPKKDDLVTQFKKRLSEILYTTSKTRIGFAKKKAFDENNPDSIHSLFDDKELNSDLLFDSLSEVFLNPNNQKYDKEKYVAQVLDLLSGIEVLSDFRDVADQIMAPNLALTQNLNTAILEISKDQYKLNSDNNTHIERQEKIQEKINDSLLIAQSIAKSLDKIDIESPDLNIDLLKDTLILCDDYLANNENPGNQNKKISSLIFGNSVSEPFQIKIASFIEKFFKTL